MREAVQKELNEISTGIESRSSIFDVQIDQVEEARIVLSGRVLEGSQLDDLRERLSSGFPGVRLDVSGVNILASGQLPRFYVRTNLTGLYEKPSFGVPLASELYYGSGVEVLQEQERWVHVRLQDGYLGWAYKPYLEAGRPAEPTHLVLAPSVELRGQPEAEAPVITRLVSGTGVLVQEQQHDWALVKANQAGWMPARMLRSLQDFPPSPAERRLGMLRDSARMIGTPYLWGGMSGNGIDCSGLSMLLHRWIGLRIPRDADQQQAAATPVEPPFEAGDLFFFGEAEAHGHVTHVGISLGGWKVIHSSRTRNGVYIDDVQEAAYLREIFLSAGSFLR